jgi:hypothetical protein
MGSETDFQMPENGADPICQRPCYAVKGKDRLNEGERQSNKSPKMGWAIDPN